MPPEPDVTSPSGADEQELIDALRTQGVQQAAKVLAAVDVSTLDPAGQVAYAQALAMIGLGTNLQLLIGWLRHVDEPLVARLKRVD
jgi:hypothetical protein